MNNARDNKEYFRLIPLIYFSLGHSGFWSLLLQNWGFIRTRQFERLLFCDVDLLRQPMGRLLSLAEARSCVSRVLTFIELRKNVLLLGFDDSIAKHGAADQLISIDRTRLANTAQVAFDQITVARKLGSSIKGETGTLEATIEEFLGAADHAPSLAEALLCALIVGSISMSPHTQGFSIELRESFVSKVYQLDFHGCTWLKSRLLESIQL